MPQPKRRTSDSQLNFQVGSKTITLRSIMVILSIISIICGSAWAGGVAYTTITSNQAIMLDRFAASDIRVAELDKDKELIMQRNLILEREIASIRRDIEQIRKDIEQIRDRQWTDSW